MKKLKAMNKFQKNYNKLFNNYKIQTININQIKMNINKKMKI